MLPMQLGHAAQWALVMVNQRPCLSSANCLVAGWLGSPVWLWLPLLCKEGPALTPDAHRLGISLQLSLGAKEQEEK